VAVALLKALSPKAEDRFPDIEAFASALLASGETAAVAIIERGAPAGPNVVPGVTRRRHQRAPYIAPCRVVRADGSNIDGRSEDISEGGLLLVLPQSLQNRDVARGSDGVESVRVRFALPTTGVVATVAGFVRWVKDGKGRAALGIEFDGAAPEVIASIATYVKLVGSHVPES
ncbi:MAG: PilZ domain-containing protein, partial [Myxococcales bacterium]|nr:PilZ domain-containing protein [Myxococcales bacterium]